MRYGLEEAGLDVVDEQTVDAKALTAKLTPAARSAKTALKQCRYACRHWTKEAGETTRIKAGHHSLAA